MIGHSLCDPPGRLEQRIKVKDALVLTQKGRVVHYRRTYITMTKPPE